MKPIVMPQLRRSWAICPKCSCKVTIYDNTANCNGVWLKCSRGCGNEFELVIKDGQQIIK